ncbi:hypothetical protein [Comamonas thiooxydans]|uniref:hypothetical protein n=1 Tax=Comamonas thiooxydans TaxID=363952 RepID=UPI000B41471F|nr:hypothetical protein [Comamonas thiooxydans]
MYSLILVVVAIALFAAMASTTLKYVPFDAMVRFQAFNVLSAGLDGLQSSVVRYLDDHRDSSGQVLYPGAVDITAEVVPIYGYLPSAKPGYDWVIQPGAVHGQQAIGICVFPRTTEAQAQAAALMPLLQTHLPQASSFIGNGCNSTANIVGGNSLTYWVMLNHLS